MQEIISFVLDYSLPLLVFYLFITITLIIRIGIPLGKRINGGK